jgi:hypothetical protein
MFAHGGFLGGSAGNGGQRGKMFPDFLGFNSGKNS